jgi:FixJ family two-component response regulator
MTRGSQSAGAAPRPPAGRGRKTENIPVLAVGASAEGLEAFRALLGSLPAKSGMAFVLVQDPDHASVTVELLSPHSNLPVVEAVGAARIEPDHIYLVPPKRYLALRRGQFRLSRSSGPTRAESLDSLLRTLAETFGASAVGVILSGAANGESKGMRAISSAAGVAATEPDGTRPGGVAAGSGPIIYIVDGDQAVRDATSDFLRRSGRRVEAFASAGAFLKQLSPDAEGCVLTYDAAPDMSGFDLLDHLKNAASRLQVIMITGNGDVRMAVRAIRSGAVDLLERPVNTSDLLASIGRALSLARDSTERAATMAEAATHIAGLTKRQRQILDLVLDGQPSKIIASRLGISQRTVESHRADIMRRTGSKSLTSLVRTALLSI